jgi:hypothetical protein
MRSILKLWLGAALDGLFNLNHFVASATVPVLFHQGSQLASFDAARRSGWFASLIIPARMF